MAMASFTAENDLPDLSGKVISNVKISEGNRPYKSYYPTRTVPDQI